MTTQAPTQRTLLTTRYLTERDIWQIIKLISKHCTASTKKKLYSALRYWQYRKTILLDNVVCNHRGKWSLKDTDAKLIRERLLTFKK